MHCKWILKKKIRSSTFFKLSNLKGSIGSKDFIAIGISNDITAYHFVRNIAKLHQKLSIIVRHFNFCYSSQVRPCLLPFQSCFLSFSFDFSFVHSSSCWLYWHISRMTFKQFLDCTLCSFQIIRKPMTYMIVCIHFCHTVFLIRFLYSIVYLDF